KLGNTERLLVDDMTKDVDLLPPYLLYSSTKEWPPIWGKTGRTFGPDRTTGAIQGKKTTVKIASGGLILAGDFAPNLDFGSAEGIIYGTDINSTNGGYSAILALTGKISGS